VIRASYARTMETPFNENLVLASTGCNDPVINALESSSSTLAFPQPRLAPAGGMSSTQVSSRLSAST